MGDSTRPAALRYIAEDDHTGYAVAAERLVRAVRDAGIEVELRGWSTGRPGGTSGVVPRSRDDPTRVAVAPPGAPTVMHLVPEHLPAVRATTDGPIVVHTVWETDGLPEHWPGLLNQADRVIVPTAWNRDVFMAAGVDVPVDVVPHVACDPTPGCGPDFLNLPDEVVVFYAISRWDERKDPELIVQAFLDAFTGDDPVALVVKTGRLTEIPPRDDWGRTSPMFWTTGWQVARLLRNYPNPPRILVCVDDWDARQIAALHTRGDCYVTLTHGEGWGVGSFDACAYGNPVIATGWSGHIEYLEGSPLLVDFALVSVEHSAPASYSPAQRWAQPRLDHAVELMRAVAADPAGARALAGPRRARILRDFAAPVVAARFLEVLGLGPGR
jgi:glycosyltransferase involved in cell wall biosynthesis